MLFWLGVFVGVFAGLFIAALVVSLFWAASKESMKR